MKVEKFVWIGAEGVAVNGVAMTPEQTYQAADFPEDVVAEWIRTKNAKASPSGKAEPKKGNE